MEISKAQELKAELESLIQKAVMKFVNATGLKVTKVDVTHKQFYGADDHEDIVWADVEIAL